METLKVKIKHIYHSGFVVELDKNVLVFDFYQGSVNFKDMKDKKVFVLSSHIHHDHFNPQILEWLKERQDIQYILSHDIKVPPQNENDNIEYLQPNQNIKIDDVKITGYNSTDEGVSFLVQCEGLSIFHAGDLNWWYWWNDLDVEIVKAEKLFREEIAKIKGEHIDIAFFPVDPRLEHNYSLGAEHFISEIKPKYFIPMHFADDYEVTKKFVEKMKHCHTTKIIELSRRDQVISLNGFPLSTQGTSL